jgi:ferredoxin
MVVKVLTGQIGLANKLLEGIEHAQNKIFMLRGDQSDQDLTVVVEPDDVAIDKSWSYLMTNLDPRARLLALLEQLSSEPQLQPEVGGNTIELPTWATFGGVSIDSDTCTMCLACASLCPTGALRAHHVGAELGFIEAVCIQCGLCEHGCPEGAIKRQPRFNYQNLRSDNMVTLNRAEMANCTQCGQAFMPTALLASALKRLTGNSVEIEHAKQMLKVCPQCRANSALQAQFPEIHGNRK